MQIQFKIQKYQTDATNAIVDIFKMQSKNSEKNINFKELKGFNDENFYPQSFITKFSNTPLNEDNILEYIQSIQKKDKLLKISQDMKEGLNFTIEMETGTGKTYVYINTIFELNKKYGWNKFIIIVPSVAIREGVHKSLEITAEHFKEKYKKMLRYFIYDTKNSSNLTNINTFSSSSNIEVIIMNYQAFATSSKESRKIYQKQDDMQSQLSSVPIEVISKANPILIIDEPQRLGKTAESKLKDFNALFTLRYSATHKKGFDFHKMYRLDAIDAYNQKLVKRISVKAIDVKSDSATGGYIFLDTIILSTTQNPKALLEIDVKQKDSVVKKSIRVSEGDNLYNRSNKLTQYKDEFIVAEINAYDNSIRFVNGIKIFVGDVIGSVQEKQLRRVQIRETIKSHIQKEKELYPKGIKVLSLFFIDEVKKYRDYESDDLKGEYALIFEEEYQNIIKEELTLFNRKYKTYLEKLNIDDIHKGYFSIDKKGKLRDPKADKNGNSNDVSAYDLIMKDKERLLSLKESTRFIFSHSALKEGWDNPNVFQICTLKHSSSTDSKRQEIGRGLRICVNKEGIRQDSNILDREFFDINTLTVIASESYDTFASSLQSEILSSLLRNTEINLEILSKTVLINDDEMEVTIGNKLASKIIDDWKKRGYINNNLLLTDIMMKDIKNKSFEVIKQLEPWKKEMKELIKQADVSLVLSDLITNGNNETPIELKPNKNWDKKEFQELWKKINTKVKYEISVDSKRLEDESIITINKKLDVSKIKVLVSSSSQKEHIEINNLSEDNDMMTKEQTHYELLTNELGTTKYDLIGEIEKSTFLTRKTIVGILKNISKDKFNQFKENPEEFIINVSKIINRQKIKLLVSGIKYFKIDERYEKKDFTIPNFKVNLSADTKVSINKHIYDYLKSDSKTEKKLAEKMDNSQIVVYAKLPNKFKIPTPLGTYNPDWAIVFNGVDKKDIYFIAETKGECENTLELKGSEELKIEYAKRYFECLNDDSISYDCIKNYDELMDKVLK